MLTWNPHYYQQENIFKKWKKNNLHKIPSVKTNYGYVFEYLKVNQHNLRQVYDLEDLKFSFQEN